MEKMNYEKPATELVEMEAADRVGTFPYSTGTHSGDVEIHYLDGDPTKPLYPGDAGY